MNIVSPPPPLVWRQDELGVINETMTGAERKAALCSLLEQEAQLIASIGQHKNAAARENKQKNTKRFLDAVSEIIKLMFIFEGCYQS